MSQADEFLDRVPEWPEPSDRCSDCAGSGLLSDPAEPCIYCGGSGRRDVRPVRVAELKALETALVEIGSHS